MGGNWGGPCVFESHALTRGTTNPWIGLRRGSMGDLGPVHVGAGKTCTPTKLRRGTSRSPRVWLASSDTGSGGGSREGSDFGGGTQALSLTFSFCRGSREVSHTFALSFSLVCVRLVCMFSFFVIEFPGENSGGGVQIQ